MLPPPSRDYQRLDLPEKLKLQFWQGLRKSDWALTFFPLTTFFHELDAFKTLHDTAFGTYGATGRFETWMLGHGIIRGLKI